MSITQDDDLFNRHGICRNVHAWTITSQSSQDQDAVKDEAEACHNIKPDALFKWDWDAKPPNLFRAWHTHTYVRAYRHACIHICVYIHTCLHA